MLKLLQTACPTSGILGLVRVGVLPILGLILALAGCSDDYYRLLKSPDGAHWWYYLTCTGGAADCLDEAHAACMSAFDVVETNATGSIGVAVARHAGNAVLSASKASTTLEVLVQCKTEVVPPGTNKAEARVCGKAPTMRTNMESGLSCPPKKAE